MRSRIKIARDLMDIDKKKTGNYSRLPLFLLSPVVRDSLTSVLRSSYI
jgi:hypothetical protein